MVQYKINTGKSFQISTIYDEWDIKESEVVRDWQSVSRNDIGKYIAFDDGSLQYGKILLVTNIYIGTSCGKYRIRDMVHCVRPKLSLFGYSGASDNDEHFLVRPPSDNEKAKANKIINGWKPKTASRRVRMLCVEKIRENTSNKGFDENFVTDRLMDWSRGNGQHAFKSLVALCNVNGISLDASENNSNDKNLSVAQRLGLSGTVQDKKRIATLTEIGKVVSVNENEVSIIENADAVIM